MSRPIRLLAILNVLLLGAVTVLVALLLSTPAEAARKPQLNIQTGTITYYVVEDPAISNFGCGSAGYRDLSSFDKVRYATGDVYGSSSYSGAVVTDVSTSGGFLSVRKGTLETESLIRCDAQVVTKVSLR